MTEGVGDFAAAVALWYQLDQTCHGTTS
jgi:hypothetical protein